MESSVDDYISLTQLLTEIKQHLAPKFFYQPYWVLAETTDIKFKPETQRYFLTLIEREGGRTLSQVNAVVWSDCYRVIKDFESKTGKSFLSNLKLLMKIRVDFHVQYGLKLVLERIDYTYTLGQLEQEKQAILAALLKNNPVTIKLVNDVFITANKRIERPIVIKNIAVISASAADGLRDFKSGLKKSKFKFDVTDYLTIIQGVNASANIIAQLENIRKESKQFDIIVIVRGGGSPTDLAPFNEYELSKCIAEFPIPIYTGIGHDRHTTISDMMANNQLNAPSDLAAYIVEVNKDFSGRIEDFKKRLVSSISNLIKEEKSNLKNIKSQFIDGCETLIEDERGSLAKVKNEVRLLNPKNILARGFAMVYAEGKLVTNPKNLKKGQKIKTVLMNKTLTSTINEITEN